MSRSAIYPLPELIKQADWDIQDSSGGDTTPCAGYSDEKKIYHMAVPLGDSPHGLTIRTHEMGHVKFSPPSAEPEKYGVRKDILLSVEDCRVNELLNRAGVGDALQGFDDEKHAQFCGYPSLSSAVYSMHPTEAALFMIASHGVAGYQKVRNCLVDSGFKFECNLADAIVDKFRNGPCTFDQTLEVTRYLETLLEVVPPTREPVQLVLEVSGDRVKKFKVSWGKLSDVQYPSLPIKVPKHIVKRVEVKLPRDEGTCIRSPHRLLMDNKVFARKALKPARGGTVLIDASGSMNFSARKLDAIVQAAPASIVALYSSIDGNEEGYLRVVARNGYRVHANELLPEGHAGGNVVDGPALEWLGKMPKPRVWLSDGKVTGVQDCQSDGMPEIVESLLHRYSIKQIKDSSKVVEFLGGSNA